MPIKLKQFVSWISCTYYVDFDFSQWILWISIFSNRWRSWISWISAIRRWISWILEWISI